MDGLKFKKMRTQKTEVSKKALKSLYMKVVPTPRVMSLQKLFPEETIYAVTA